MASKRERSRDVALMVAGVLIGLGGSILSSLFLHGTAAAIAALLMVVIGIALAAFGWVDFRRDSAEPKPPISVDVAVLRELLAEGRLMEHRLSPGVFGGISHTQADHDILNWRSKVERELMGWPSVLEQFQAVMPRNLFWKHESEQYAGLARRLKILEKVVQ
jgi:hypothetical protein